MSHEDGAFASGSVAVVKLNGDVNYATVQPLSSHMSTELRRGRVNMVLDMQDVESLSSGALGTLLLRQTDAERLGGTIKIAGASPEIQKKLEATGFTAVFEVFDTAEAALESFRLRFGAA